AACGVVVPSFEFECTQCPQGIVAVAGGEILLGDSRKSTCRTLGDRFLHPGPGGGVDPGAVGSQAGGGPAGDPLATRLGERHMMLWRFGNKPGGVGLVE